MRLKSVEANAKKAVAQAEGAAQALKIKGDAEAEYNRKIAASLSALIVQTEFLWRSGMENCLLMVLFLPYLRM